MKFQVVNDSNSLSEGYSIAKFQGIEEITLPSGTNVFKLQFKLCVMKAGAPVEIEFNTGVIASSKENPGVLSEQVVKQLCESVGVAYNPVIDIPAKGEDLGAFGTVIKIYMKKKIHNGRDILNMGWQDGRIMWPAKVTTNDTPEQKEDYGI